MLHVLVENDKKEKNRITREEKHRETTDLTGVFLLRYSIDVIGKNDYFYLERFIYIQIYYIFARLHTDTHTHTHDMLTYIYTYIHIYVVFCVQ